MKVSSVQPKKASALLINNPQVRQSVSSRNTSFHSKQSSCKEIEERIFNRYFIRCHSDDNKFLANCVEKTAGLFYELFGLHSLPDRVTYEPLSKSTMGLYRNYTNEVSFNSDRKMFNNKFRLKMSSLSNFNLFSPNDFSTLHSASVFTHEFGHSAHWHNLEERHGQRNAEKVWSDLAGYMVPDPVGKLIIRFKLGNYAVDSEDMCEFMAERIAKDICDNLSGSEWKLRNKPDVGYEDIFQRKWNYRYTSPQSYLDYFTQQVWNGDSEEAFVAADKIKDFLKLVEEGRAVEEAIELHNRLDPPRIKVRQLAEIQPVSEVHPVVEKVKTNTQKISSSFLSSLANSIYARNSRITQNLDNRNRVLLKL